MNKATEVMMQYVENLKRTYEKDHAELMEFKKLANQNSNRCYGVSGEPGGKDNTSTATKMLWFSRLGRYSWSNWFKKKVTVFVAV